MTCRRKVLCTKCGRDITRAFKFYIHCKPYCYECSEEYKAEKRKRREEGKDV